MPTWKNTEDKFKSLNKNITFSETVALLNHYGYIMDHKGKTSGSRIRFTCEGHGDILLRKPHPQKELKQYVIKDLHNVFKQEGFWNE